MEGREFWDSIVENVGKRFNGWKRAYISKKGRLTLVQSILASISTYFTSLFQMPGKIVRIIKKMMKDFLWEGSRERKNDHLIN